MKSFKKASLTLMLTVSLSATAFAGNIGGMRTTSAGNIGGMRTTSAGNIGGMRTTSTGNIGGMRTTSATGAELRTDETRWELFSREMAGNIGGLFTFVLSALVF